MLRAVGLLGALRWLGRVVVSLVAAGDVFLPAGAAALLLLPAGFAWAPGRFCRTLLCGRCFLCRCRRCSAGCRRRAGGGLRRQPAARPEQTGEQRDYLKQDSSVQHSFTLQPPAYAATVLPVASGAKAHTSTLRPRAPFRAAARPREPAQIHSPAQESPGQSA